MAHKKKASYADILRECAGIADDREPVYGEAVANMEEIAYLCDALFGLKLTAVQVVQVMIAVKFARQKHKHKKDNLIDTINYTAILLRVLESENG